MGGAVFLCVSLLFDLRPNYCNENNGELLQKVPCTHCWTQSPWTCSRPPSTHTSTGDSWTLSGMSGSVSYGITAPLSWVLVHTRLCLCPPRVCFPCPVWVLVALWWGQWWPPPRGLIPHRGLLHPESLPLWQATADPCLHRRHSNTVLTQFLWSLLVCCEGFVWALCAFLMGMRVWF